MDTRKIFAGALHISGAALALAGTVSIAYLCERGLTAPLREEALEDEIHAARKRGRQEGEHRARPEAYELGLQDGKRQGRTEGRRSGYDEGYLAGFHKDLYNGETQEVLTELGLDPEEHAKQLAAKKAEEDAAGWGILEKIFAKKPGDESGVKLAPPNVPTPAEALAGMDVEPTAGLASESEDAPEGEAIASDHPDQPIGEDLETQGEETTEPEADEAGQCELV